MKLIKPQYQIINQEEGLEGIYKQIELAARNCYKSESVEGVTPEAFVERLIKSKHLSVLEHGTVYLKISTPFSPPSDMDFTEHMFVSDSLMSGIIRKYQLNPYSKVTFDENDTISAYITSNLRVLQENGWLGDLKYLCEPTEFHEKRVTVKFTSNIHFYKDLTRHRRMSYSIESTRYCNYSKDRFGKELTFILPVWYNEDVDIDDIKAPEWTFRAALYSCEAAYINLINKGWQPQQAAEVLPQATKADIIVTGFVSDWKHIFNLRTSIIAETGQPHPELSRLFDPLYNEFKELSLIKNI